MRFGQCGNAGGRRAGAGGLTDRRGRAKIRGHTPLARTLRAVDTVSSSQGPSAPPPAGSCPQGQLDFNDGKGCVAVCKPGQVDVGDGNGCVAPAAECQGSCITDFAGTFDNAGTCAAL